MWGQPPGLSRQGNAFWVAAKSLCKTLKKRNFEEVFLLLLKKSAVNYDPRLVFG